MSSSSPVSPSASTPNGDRIAESVHAALPATIAELSRLVRIPSIAWEGFDHSEVRRSAEAIAELVEGLGVFEKVSIEQSEIPGTGQLGQPAILATRGARNGRPTILLYAHHDVQPVGDESLWESAPFEPTTRDGRLYGRGSADDKAGIASHLAAIRALVDARGDDFDLGIVLFFEGEEEFGSRSFEQFLADHEAELAADVIIVADSGNWSTEIPALTVGLRGNVRVQVKVTTLEHASHSGMFGGAVPDAMLAAVRLLDTLWTEDGSVAVAGMTVREAETPAYDEAQLRSETGLLPEVSPIGTGTFLSRLWDKPTVTITGIDAPSIKNASNTLIPTVTVQLSARVAPGQTGEAAWDALREHLLANAPFGARVEFADVDLGDPFLVDTSGWAAAEALDTMREGWGAEPVKMGAGGSIPFVASLVERFPGAQILITGVEDPDSRAHSPNESLDLGSFHRAILSEALLLARLDARG
ncbi:dipeptidase [Schumannella sp. 10F1B-5-1]|uniref:dipeptidase n=1 Tax=Schumannella sp. 10F1B-5-1 TaxID=2590780 RepID=UPI0011325C06|nr:dipeptidase [Schumannella sp. 10F1B-5-1]TPW73819.1 dipeptidase [Schumannella sp. 10F1B-5-1]